MKRTEKVLISLAVLSIVGDMFHVTGATLGILLSAAGLAFFYLVFSFAHFNDISLKQAIKGETPSPIPGIKYGAAIFAGITLNTVIIGILFTFQLWPGANIFFKLALILLLVLTVLLLGLESLRGTSLSMAILKRVALFGGLAIFFVFLPLRTLLTWHYPDAPAYIEAEVALDADPTNEALKQKAEAEWESYNEKYLEQIEE